MSEIKHSHYTHIHHIIPKHEWKVRFGNLKGFNAPDNLSPPLYIEQHAQVHFHYFNEITHLEYDRLAGIMLSGQMGKEELQRELARINGKRNKGRKETSEQCLAKSLRSMGENNPFYGRIHTQATKEFLSESLGGDKSVMYGKPKSAQTKALMSAVAKGKPKSEIHKSHMRKPKSPEHREAIRLSKLGTKQKPEQIEARRYKLLGKVPWNKGRKWKKGIKNVT